MPPITNNSWNSLEIIKLVISCLTPVFVLIVGLFINKQLKKFEHVQWRNQKLIEKRLTIYDDLAPLLNDILCYYTYVGNWKEQTPNEILSLKRKVDKKIYLAAPLFCEKFFLVCIKFVNLCYESYTGWGEDAKLKTKIQRRKEVFGNKWDNTWDHLFCNDSCSKPAEIREAYLEIMNIFAEEIGLHKNNLKETGEIPSNII